MVEDLYRSIETRGQRIINLFKVLGHCPYVGLNWHRLGNSLLRGEELPARLREPGSRYEFAQHTAIGLRTGLTQQQIAAIPNWPSSTEFSEEERTVLAYTDEVEQDIRVRDETFAALKVFLSEHAIVELTVAIGYYGMVSRFLVALDVELEDGTDRGEAA
jgi:alkylhydroperoxidase family enzyme